MANLGNKEISCRRLLRKISLEMKMIKFELSLKERAFKENERTFRTIEGRKALRVLGNLRLAWNLQRVKGSR